MLSQVSFDAARRLRPEGAFHMPPGACPIHTVAELILEETEQQPEIILTDTRRDFQWRVMMTRVGDLWTAQILMPQQPTVLNYHFVFPDETVLYETRQVEGKNKPIYGKLTEKPFQIAVYDPDRMPPEWSQGMVIYQIFPDRFANGDTSTDREANGTYGHPPVFKEWGAIPESPPLGRDFYGGDLRGVIEKLDYLADLGVECLYFNPIFWSPTNHRYDALDYLRIDPMLGTEADFDELIAGAKQRGMRIILDAVYNHCSSDSKYFNFGNLFPDVQGAIQSPESPYYRWFHFTDYPTKWRGWWGFSHMPEFEECPEVEEFFMGEAGPTGFWTLKGVDGWRTDVTGDNSDEFWRRWRERLDTYNSESYTVAEEWEDASRYLVGDMFSATMNYRFTWALYGFVADDALTATQFDDRLQTWMRDTPPPALRAQMNLIDSHDTLRALTACGGDLQRFRQMIGLQLAYPGAPTIYYGDETGLQGENAEDGRRCFPWDAIDQDLHAFYKQALTVRKASDALRLGDVETLIIDDEQRAYTFARRAGDEVVYILTNASDNSITLLLADALPDVELNGDLLGLNAAPTKQDGQWRVTLHPRSTGWYQQRS